KSIIINLWKKQCISYYYKPHTLVSKIYTLNLPYFSQASCWSSCSQPGTRLVLHDCFLFIIIKVRSLGSSAVVNISMVSNCNSFATAYFYNTLTPNPDSTTSFIICVVPNVTHC